MRLTLLVLVVPMLAMHPLKWLETASIAPVALNESQLQSTACKARLAAYRANMERVRQMPEAPVFAAFTADAYQKCICFVANEFSGKHYFTTDVFNARREEIEKRMAWAMDIALQKRSLDTDGDTRRAMTENMESHIGFVRPELHAAFEALLGAMVIQAYTTLEVLAEDLWRAVVDARPSLLSGMSSTKKKSIRFRSRERIRLSYEYTFQSDRAAIDAALKDTAIDELALLRCMLVHSAGKVDDWFMRDSAAVAHLPRIAQWRGLALGAAIEISGELVRELINPVTHLGSALILEVDQWLLRNP